MSELPDLGEAAVCSLRKNRSASKCSCNSMVTNNALLTLSVSSLAAVYAVSEHNITSPVCWKLSIDP